MGKAVTCSECQVSVPLENTVYDDSGRIICGNCERTASSVQVQREAPQHLNFAEPSSEPGYGLFMVIAGVVLTALSFAVIGRGGILFVGLIIGGVVRMTQEP